MALVLPFEGRHPRIADSVFLCPGAVVVGDVEIGDRSSVWFNTVIRGDVNSVSIGSQTNIQDLCMLHVTNNRAALRVGSNVTIGHGAIVHGCTIHDEVLIGMGAKVLDHCVVGSQTIIAAGSVLPERSTAPSGVLMAGVPARVVRPLREEEFERFLQSAAAYVAYADRYRSDRTFPPVQPS
ncbi:MAG: gamma carbonic anhydrase family protein [Candidatus Kapaibacterium sp.]